MSDLMVNDLNDDSDLTKFGKLWDSASALLSLLQKLPSELVLKSGQSARRNRIIDRWENLDSPGLNGEVSKSSLDDLNLWIHDSSVLISYISNIGSEKNTITNSNNFKRIYSVTESEFISEKYSWPWDAAKSDCKIKSVTDRPAGKKEKLIKFGIVAGLGVIAAVTYMDEE